MPLYLRIVLVVASVLFLCYVLRMVKKERMLLKYSLMWLFLGVAGVLAAVFPGWVFWLAAVLGFELPVNFLMFACILFLMVVSLLFCAILSKHSVRIKQLAQETALQDQRIAVLEKAAEDAKREDPL